MNDEERAEIARELVIRTESTTVDKPVTMALDKFVPQLNEIHECQENVEYWTQRLAQLKEALGEVMGEAVEGTVGGLPVVRYKRVQKFRGTEFVKAYPNLAQAYQRERVIRELDVDLIKHGRPDLYAEFQSRPMSVDWNPNAKDRS